MFIDTTDFTQKYNEAYALRAWGEQDGEADLLWLAGALFFDIHMYAASARCRERAAYLKERQDVLPSQPVENTMVHEQG